MTIQLPADDLRLTVDPQCRLFHVGVPKTGTTALQRTAAGQRDRLLELGVLYPDRRTTNHRKATFAFTDRPVSWSGPSAVVPDKLRWTRLLAEIKADAENRVWLSNENLSEEPEDRLRELLDAVGGSQHVVLTMRSLPAQLASAWQQYLKSGVFSTFEYWLERVLSDVPDPPITPSFKARSDLGGIVEKWARLVGEDQVTVVVLDPANRALVPRTFETLLGLPTGLLDAQLEGSDLNRSMTFAEAELIRSINEVVRDRDEVDWGDYQRFIRDGAIDQMLKTRDPGAAEAPIVPPTWAVDRAVALAEIQIDRIAATNVRLVGDLSHLAARVPSVERMQPPEVVPVDAAREALLAVLSTGLGRGPDFGPLKATRGGRAVARAKTSNAHLHLQQLRTRTLVKALAARVVRAGRRRLTRGRQRDAPQA
ncbi:MAG TPA: hypothetical protein VIT20_03205 [Propionibacteriaceae bacterium]